MTSQSGGVRTKRVILVLVVLVLAVAITLVSLIVVTNTRDVERLSGPLPIDLPDTSELQNSPKKVFAHYFPPYPLSRDNESADVDYYTREYLDPQGEGGRHAEYGGLLRERPLPVPVGNADSWELDNMKTEITRAGQAGIDGFSVDILSIDTANWEQVETAVAAATQLDNGFEILLTPDAHVLDVSPAALAEAIAELAKSPAVTRLADGRLVISPFAPEKLGAGWWRAFLRIMETEHEETVALLPCFLNYNEGASDFEAISYGFSNWGFRSPAANDDLRRTMDDAHERGKLWMQPVSGQDARPSQGTYDEANNTENLRVTWAAAIDAADWVQLVTWNDYAEGTEIAPSTHIGWSLLDISSFYIAMFKLGRAPAVVRDVIYLSHRVQFVDAIPTGGQTVLMEPRRGSSAPRDRVEVLAFLTRPAEITLNSGNDVHRFAAAGGVSTFTAPLREGSISASVNRDGSLVAAVESPFTVQRIVERQDLQYHFVSSGRQEGESTIHRGK